VVLAACHQIEMTIKGILTRTGPLGIREIDAFFIRHPNFDPGCCLTPHDFLRSQINRFSRALVVLDHEGSGREHLSPDELSNSIRTTVERNGWQGRVEVIVLVPELEIWVWSQSPRVERELGWAGASPTLREWLTIEGFFVPDEAKPKRPKEALLKALEEKKIQRSASLYYKLAQTVGLSGCNDKPMAKLCETLRTWFPAT